MHKTCDGCISLHTEGHETCELGYKIKHILRHGCKYTFYSVPLEKCVKPTKYSQLIAIQLLENSI